MKPDLEQFESDSMGIFQWKEGNGQYYKKYVVEFYKNLDPDHNHLDSWGNAL